jgi:chloramphenicol-sensitive protein RarD
MNPGLLYAALAYAMWGLFPLYFRQVAAVSSFEIVVQRCVWALLVLVIALSLMRRWSWLGQVLRQPRQLALFGLSALLLSANWLVYVWAVNHERVIDASLGYFITPLVNVLLGYVVLHERLRRAQVAAVALAAVGVLWLTLQAGQLPWIGLVLAASFGCYGLMRKTASLGALEGLALETLLLAPLAIPLLLWLTSQDGGALASGDASLIAWLLLAGPLTVVPLLLFAAGARRITMATLGLLQYIGPTIQFALGVWLYHEPFGGARLAGFALIWFALAVYSAESWWVSRRRAAPELSTV